MHVFPSELTVWKKLEEENAEFFKAYYLRLMVKHQVIEYNKLLEQQVHHMRLMHPTGAASVQNRNGSHVPSSKICLELHFDFHFLYESELIDNCSHFLCILIVVNNVSFNSESATVMLCTQGL